MIALIMMYFAPPLFVGIAFDSGGVASGPMTATFILAYAQGVAEAIEGASVVTEGFWNDCHGCHDTTNSFLQILGLRYLRN